MPDTSRTADELKALFPDNALRSIHPSAMRDFIESLKNPVTGGGFEPKPHIEKKYMSLVIGKDSVTPLFTLPKSTGPASYGHIVQLTWSIAGQPAGTYRSYQGANWLSPTFTQLGSNPDSAWGLDILANQAILLPYGVYEYSMLAGVKAADAFAFPAYTPGPNFPLALYLDQAKYDSVGWSAIPTDGSVPWVYPKYTNDILWSDMSPPSLNQSGKTQIFFATGSVMNDMPDPQPFIALAYTGLGQTVEDINLVVARLSILKVA